VSRDERVQTLKNAAKSPAVRVLSVLVAFALGGWVFGGTSSSSNPHAGQANSGSSSAKPASATIWTCSMHPQIQQSDPGKCPICGMDLIPVSNGDDQNSGTGNHVVLSERARALAQIRTTEVRRVPGTSANLRLLGRMEANETTLKTVTAWTGGRIDHLRVRVTGERVHAGQVIATLYSPEVFTAHQDLLVAKRLVKRLAQSPESSRQAAQSTVDAARQRLMLLGVPNREITTLEKQDRPTRSIAIRSPFGGTVIERLVSEGAYVTTGAPLYRIANLKNLWVQLDAYESDLPRISLKQTVTVMVDALPGESFEGKVSFIDPTLDPVRRTAKVRVDVDNRDGRLRPGMFAEATVAAGNSEGEQRPLVIPATAPLFTGRRSVVYVELHDGKRIAYEPQTVRLGSRLGDYYPVIAGLSEGQRVVSHGAFVLDADLQIRGGRSMMSFPDDKEPGAWDTTVNLSATERAKLAPVLKAYLEIQKALAEDNLEKAKKAAEQLGTALSGVKLVHPQAAIGAWLEVRKAIEGHVKHIGMSSDLENARSGFQAISQGIQQLLKRFGNPLSDSLQLAYCPMAFDKKGATWIQESAKIENSYFGASMPTCGEIKQEIATGSYLKTEQGTQSPPPVPHVGGHHH
jgi:membrane fusion protein, copper/silver efflux system